MRYGEKEYCSCELHACNTYSYDPDNQELMPSDPTKISTKQKFLKKLVIS